MNDDFVPLELALKLKEKGFTCEYPFAMYNKYEQFCPLYSSDKHYFGIDDFDEHACIAPTISQVLKWLREEKKIFIEIQISSQGYWCCIYENVRYEGNKDFRWDNWLEEDVINEKETYELAALAGVSYCLDNLN